MSAGHLGRSIREFLFKVPHFYGNKMHFKTLSAKCSELNVLTALDKLMLVMAFQDWDVWWGDTKALYHLHTNLQVPHCFDLYKTSHESWWQYWVITSTLKIWQGIEQHKFNLPRSINSNQRVVSLSNSVISWNHRKCCKVWYLMFEYLYHLEIWEVAGQLLCYLPNFRVIMNLQMKYHGFHSSQVMKISCIFF